jgi:hypothetical protein
LTTKELEHLEKRHQKNLEDISKTLSSRTGIHHSHIRDKLHELIEKIPADRRLQLKIHMLRIGTPIAFVLLAESMTGLTAPPHVVWGAGIGGALMGWLESAGAVKKLQQLEREHAERVTVKLKKII